MCPWVGDGNWGREGGCSFGRSLGLHACEPASTVRQSGLVFKVKVESHQIVNRSDMRMLTLL